LRRRGRSRTRASVRSSSACPRGRTTPPLARRPSERSGRRRRCRNPRSGRGYPCPRERRTPRSTPPPRARREQRRTSHRSARTPGCCTRTQGSRRAPSGRGRSLAGEDVRERLDVDGVQDAPPLRLLQPGYELGPQDVDLSVQQPPAIRHLLLLAREVVDELLQILVGQCRKIRQRFHRALSSRVKLNFSLCPRLEQKRY